MLCCPSPLSHLVPLLRALEEGKREPILKPHILLDELLALADKHSKPEVKTCGFARLLQVT